MNKLNLALLFGGQSAEHEVSLQSARNIALALNKEKYTIILIGISKRGRWKLVQENFWQALEADAQVDLTNFGEEVVLLNGSGGELYNLKSKEIVCKLDVAMPAMHGPMAEDGTIQGLLKLTNVPFVGAGVLGSAVGMDKEIMKKLLRDANLPIGKFICLKNKKEILSFAEAQKELGLPIFVKPANMGSSVGINKVENEADYFKAIEEAFKYDSKILLEEFIKAREIECAVLGGESPEASVLGEIKPKHSFYSYEAKYLDDNGADMAIPAVVDKLVDKEIKELAIKTFIVLNCFGLGRVDFFLKENNEIFINEINTLPGFTKISMYPKLWEASGLKQTDLLDRLIQLALERF